MAFKANTCKFKHALITPSIDAVIDTSLVQMMAGMVVSIDCKFGSECFTKGCFYKHPEGWDHRKNTNCKFGIKCKNKETTCEFKHVKIEKKTVEASGGSAMEIEKKKIDPKPKKSVVPSSVSASVSATSGGGGGMNVDINIGEKIKLAVHRKKKSEAEQMVV
jgi:hypothetical protein